jgi:hypothetical protein
METTFAPSPDDGGLKPPDPTTPDNPEATAMDDIEESKLFHYQTKIQLYDPRAASEHVENKLENKVKEWLFTLKQAVKNDIKVENNDGHEIKLTGFPFK